MTDLGHTDLLSIRNWMIGNIRVGFTQAATTGALCLVLIALLEVRAGRNVRAYASRHFWTDILHRAAFIVYMAVLYQPLQVVVRRLLPVPSLSILNRAPLWAALVAYWVILDFIGYWIHRAQHSRLLWRFHRVHHSQEVMTFATGFRNHPVDQLFASCVSLLPGLLLGAPLVTWLPYAFLLAFIDATHHARLGWRLGPLRRVFVSPIFHAAHHATDSAIYNRNFGGLLSIWDFLFGTAHDAERFTERTGVLGWQVAESWWAHLLSPFRRNSVVESRGSPTEPSP